MILAGLVRKPRSGYDLTRWMQRETSHYFKVGHNRVYPALSELERDGLVVHKVVPSDRGPERKEYSITEAGREAMLSWVDSPPIERSLCEESGRLRVRAAGERVGRPKLDLPILD